MITPQNVLSGAQVKNFFISWKRYVPVSRYSSFCIFSYPMMNISTWDRLHFLNVSFEPQLQPQPQPQVSKLGQLVDISKGNNFPESFETIWMTGIKFQTLFNLATCSNYSITNYVKIPVFRFFEKVSKGQLKMVNVNH